MALAQLVPGANCPVPFEKLHIEVILSPARMSGIEVDVSAFVLTTDGKVRGDEDMVFYGQPCPGNGSVEFLAKHAECAQFNAHLPALLSGTEKIAFTATIHENRTNFSAFNHLQIMVKNAAGDALLQATLPASSMVESALIVGELYRRHDQWKFRAVGQGFAGGLKPLAEHFGVDIDDSPAPAAAQASSPVPANKPVSLSKVTLDKARSRVSLEKKTEGFGEIRINLNWNRRPAPAPQSGGFLGGLLGGASSANKGVDLDVGCLYEQHDGTINVIQALGNSLGALHRDPFIELKGDDRTGAIGDGEWLHINGEQWASFKRILIFAFIYEGTPNWAATDGVVTIYVPNEPPLEIPMTQGANAMRMCAVVLLENLNGALQVNREVRYFKGHQEMDKAYRWGLNWRAGSK